MPTATGSTASASPIRSATRWFWTLTATAILLAGGLSRELSASPSPRTGLAVAVTGILLVAALAQAARVLSALVRTPPHQDRHDRADQGRGET